jgi:hypothetical protein
LDFLKYLPWIKATYQNKPVTTTVHQLLNKNSGVPGFDDNESKANISIEQVTKDNLNELKLINNPRTTFLYK